MIFSVIKQGSARCQQDAKQHDGNTQRLKRQIFNQDCPADCRQNLRDFIKHRNALSEILQTRPKYLKVD